MSPTVVFAKTDKGRDEIATRQHKLSSKPRAILILVDGKRRVQDLQARNEGPIDVRQVLEQLEAQGFIARVAGAAPRLVAPVRPTTPAEPLVPAPAAPAAPDLDAARALAVRLLGDAMGRAADGFAPRLARCATEKDLLAHAERYAIVIGTMRDARVAEHYLRSVREALKAA